MNEQVSAAIAQTEQLMTELDTMLCQREQQDSSRQRQQRERNTVSQEAAPKQQRTKSKNRAANQAALQLLMETYPQVFNRDNVRPLKIGIQEDLIADEKVAKNKIKRALASYVRSISYYKSLQEGADRVDLAGEASGQVTEQEAQHAKEKLKEINKARREKQKESRQAEKSDRINRKLEALVSLNKR